jgi:hypothetical protein
MLRPLLAAVAIVVPALSVLGSTGCQQLLDNGASGSGSGDGGVASAATGSSAPANVGGGCGTETTSGLELCTAVSQCPNVVVDTQAMPHCGFRLRSGVADLVCVCGASLCSMGLFGSCDEASHLLTDQTEATVCAQVADGRCSEASSSPAPAPSTTATAPAPSTETTPTTPSAPQSGNPACDHQCMQDCGGGAGCASVCNCG